MEINIAKVDAPVFVEMKFEQTRTASVQNGICSHWPWAFGVLIKKASITKALQIAIFSALEGKFILEDEEGYVIDDACFRRCIFHSEVYESASVDFVIIHARERITRKM